jgi:transposase-like protein
LLVELSVIEQRYQAIMAVLQDGWKVTEGAAHVDVARLTVHNWIRAFGEEAAKLTEGQSLANQLAKGGRLIEGWFEPRSSYLLPLHSYLPAPARRKEAAMSGPPSTQTWGKGRFLAQLRVFRVDPKRAPSPSPMGRALCSSV